MSYEKVKSIKIETDRVLITCASNNVRPLTYYKEEYPYFSNLLKTEGKQAVELALLRNYEEGNLQGGSNKYQKALMVLLYVLKEEYQKFNWNNFSYEERDKEKELRESQEFKDLLLKALNYKIPKEKYIISKPYGEGKVYINKITSRSAKWCYEKEKAKRFDFEKQAEFNKGLFRENQNWIIEEII